jgi:hypothetical protein
LSWRDRGTGDLTTHGFRASFPASVFWRLGAALRCQRDGNGRLLRVHVGDGRDADARRLDNVDGVDADARTDVARRRGVVPWHVGRERGKFYSIFEGGTNFNEIGDAPFGIFYGSPVPPQFVTPFVDRGTGNVEGQRFPVPLPTTDTVINWANYLPIGTSPLSGTGTFCPTPKSTNCPSNDKSVRRPY